MIKNNLHQAPRSRKRFYLGRPKKIKPLLAIDNTKKIPDLPKVKNKAPLNALGYFYQSHHIDLDEYNAGHCFFLWWKRSMQNFGMQSLKSYWGNVYSPQRNLPPTKKSCINFQQYEQKLNHYFHTNPAAVFILRYAIIIDWYTFSNALKHHINGSFLSQLKNELQTICHIINANSV